MKILIMMGLLGLTACGDKKETTLDNTQRTESYSYSFNDNGCRTGEHKFSNLDDYCRGLQDEERNRGCAVNMRSQAFEAKDCENRLGERF